MKSIVNPFARLLDRVQRRYRTARPGSVLILVVALLVLMALLGTAYISTTRIDRYTARQHATNVQIDLLVDGVVNLATSAISSDLRSAAGVYRPGDTAANFPSGYDHWDSPGAITPVDPTTGTPRNTIPQDVFLAARFPRTRNPDLAYDNVSNPAVWDAVTYPLIRTYDTANPNHDWRFDSPDTTAFTLLSAPFYMAPAAPTVGGSYIAKPWFEPTFKPVNGVNYPAFRGYYLDNTGALQTIAPFLAADADGDGVADSGLWKLPVGRIDGVTYYAAVRIIDNNSAINVNTAWSNKEFDGNGAVLVPPRYFFPGSVGLAELLRTYDPTAAAAVGNEVSQLSLRRFNNYPTSPTGVTGGGGSPVDDTGANITGFEYGSQQDALNSQLGNRLANPGSVAPSVFAQKFSDSDAASLAYHFCLINPDATPSPLEALFYNASANNSIYGAAVGNFGARQSSYPVSQTGIDGWFQNSFDFFTETPFSNTPTGNFLQRRSMLVTSSPVSNQAPVHALPQFALDAGIAVFPADPPKTSINQAPFADLWRAFLQVMIEPVELPPGAGASFIGSPVDVRTFYAAAKLPLADIRPTATTPATDPPTINNPYLGTTFSDYNMIGGGYVPFQDATPSFNPLVPVTAAIAPTDYHPSRMFRSPVRAVPDPIIIGGFDINTPRLDAHQMTLLRSALAALNAQDLRDSDNDVTAQRIVLTAISGNARVPVDTIVYGTERQPYITEVFAETDNQYTGTGGRNPYGYVAIELYNPYPQDIVLTNWKLVAIDRRSTEIGGVGSGSPLPPYRNNAMVRGAMTCPSPRNLPLDNSTLIADLDPNFDADAIPDVILPGGALWGVGSLPLVVPAGGYLILENYAASGAPTALRRPACTGLPETGDIPAFNAGNDSTTDGTAKAGAAGLPQVNIACIPGLSGVVDINWTQVEWPAGFRSVLNRELVILRPRRADGQYSLGEYPAIPTSNPPVPLPLAYDETPNPLGGLTNLRELVPVDSFDFTGLKLPYDGVTPTPEPLGKPSAGNTSDPSPNLAAAWHYVRENVGPNTTLPNWKFVYPGRYDANPTVLIIGSDPRPRQAGTQHTEWICDAVTLNPWEGGQPPVPFSFGYDPVGFTEATADNPAASYPTSFKIPLAYNNFTPNPTNTTALPTNTVGPNPILLANPVQTYPFGGFARNGDMLQTPFIGAYSMRYQTVGSPFTVAEINSVSMDSVFAEDTDIHDDPFTNLTTGDELAAPAGGAGTREREQIGRFAPIRSNLLDSFSVINDYSAAGYPNINFTDYATPGVAVNDFGYDPSYNAITPPTKGADWEPFWRYRWATDLFDYLAVSSPADDYLPNYPMQKEFVPNTLTPYFFGDLVSYYNPDPTNPRHEIYHCTAPGPYAGLTPVGGSFTLAFTAKAVQNGTAAAAFRGGTVLQASTENGVPVEGLININTANWRVLSALPMIVNPNTGLPDDAGSGIAGFTYRQLNAELAKIIVYWRDVDANPDAGIYQPHGPFKSIFELNQVVDTRLGAGTLPVPWPAGTRAGFQNAMGTLPLPNTALPEANDALGDLAPIGVATDGVRGDMKERMQQLTRISNMITTRSDSFTCYILVQGWQDAGTINAKLVVQRRVGYIVDRSKVTPANTGAMVKQAFTNN